MRFLVDNALSPDVADGLQKEGYDAVHVRDAGLGAAEDHDIFFYAAKEGRIIVSADTDFSTLLAQRREIQPSVILFRRGANRRPKQQVDLLLANITALHEVLCIGCVVVFDESRMRIRMLPIME